MKKRYFTMKRITMLALTASLLLSINCDSDDDVLATFKGGHVTRGELRTMLTVRNRPLESPSLSTKLQSSLLKQIALSKIAGIEISKSDFKKKDDYKNIKFGTELSARTKYLSLLNRQKLQENDQTFYRLQVLFLRYPDNTYRETLLGEINPADITENPRIKAGNTVYLLPSPDSTSKELRLFPGQEVQVLSKTGELKTVKNEKAYMYQVRVVTESSAYTAHKNQKGNSKVKPTKGKTGYVFGADLHFSLKEEEQTKRKEAFKKEAAKVLAEMKTKSGYDLDRYIAEKTDERSARIYAGIKPWASMLERFLPGNERLTKVEKLEEGQYLEEVYEPGGPGLELIYLRGKKSIPFSETQALLEEHFDEMYELAGKLGKDIKDLEKRAERMQKQEPDKQAEKWASRIEQNIMRGGDQEFLDQIKKTDGYEFNESFDPSKADSLIMKTDKNTLKVVDLEKYFKMFYPDRPWDISKENMVRSFGTGFGQAMMLNDYFTTLTLNDEQKKTYQNIYDLFLGQKNIPYYLENAHPPESLEVTDSEVKADYEKNKNTRWTKKTGKTKSVVPFAEAKEIIFKQMQQRKKRTLDEKLKKDMYDNYNVKIMKDVLKNGKV